MEKEGQATLEDRRQELEATMRQHKDYERVVAQLKNVNSWLGQVPRHQGSSCSFTVACNSWGKNGQPTRNY